MLTMQNRLGTNLRTHSSCGELVTRRRTDPDRELTDLTLVEGVGDGDSVLGTVLVGDLEGQVLAGGELLQSENRDLVGSLDLVVVGLVLEPQGKHTLLLQVGLVDSGERLDDDGGTTQEPGFESLYREGQNQKQLH